MAKAETEFKRWWLGQWNGWHETYEPRRGSGVGIPDVQVAVAGRLIPLEFKVGKIDKNGILWIDEVRPDQIGWHKRASLSGIKTFFVVGVKCKPIKYEVFYIEGNEILGWEKGFRNIAYFNHGVGGLVYLI